MIHINYKTIELNIIYIYILLDCSMENFTLSFNQETMEHIVISSMKALNMKDIEGARNLLRISIQILLVRGVSSIIPQPILPSSILPPPM